MFLRPLLAGATFHFSVAILLATVATSFLELTKRHPGRACHTPGTSKRARHSATVTLKVPIPFDDLARLGAGALVVMALVAGVGLLFLRMSTDLQEIRVG